MSVAAKYIRTFAALLDIAVTRAAAVWARINADGSVSFRTAAETRSDIGAGTGSGTVTSVTGATFNGVTITFNGSATTPTISAMSLGAIVPTSVNGATISGEADSGIILGTEGQLVIGDFASITVSDEKTAAFLNSLTFSGTDGSTLNIGAGGTLGTAAFTAASDYSPVAGSSSIATTGTVTSGTWSSAFAGSGSGLPAVFATASAASPAAVAATTVSTSGSIIATSAGYPQVGVATGSGGGITMTADNSKGYIQTAGNGTPIQLEGSAVVVTSTLSVTGTSTLTGGLIGGVQPLSGAGAVNLTTVSTAFTSTGTLDALTLANGSNGQLKSVAHVSDGGSGLLTPTTANGFSTITFTNAGDSVLLQYFTTGGWVVLGSKGAVIA